MHRLIFTAIIAAAIACGPGPSSVAEAKKFDPAKMLFWDQATQLNAYRSFDEIFPTRRVAKGETLKELPDAGRDYALTFEHVGRTWTIDDFILYADVAGLLILKDGEILVERYQNGNTPHTRWTSFSMAKSIVSTLVGAAVKDGSIASLDDPVTKYLPEFERSGYDGTTVRQLLQMSSGVRWNEDYTQPDANVNDLIRLAAEGDGERLIDGLMMSLPRENEPGTTWHYNTGETQLIGEIVTAATDKNLSDYLSAKIWAAYGMEKDASWGLVSVDGAEFAGCCFNATLRDYGRLGQFLLGGGMAAGKPVVGREWIAEATAPSSSMRNAFGYAGYGYQWWTHADGAYQAIGVFGQGLYVNPAAGVVVVVLSTHPAAIDPPKEALQIAFIDALVADLKNAPPH